MIQFNPVTVVTKDLKPFDASHQLTSHKGKCRNLHGHTYHVRVTVGTALGIVDDKGMVIDFAFLSEIYQPIYDKIDHALLMGEHKPRWFDILGANCDNIEDIAQGGVGKIAYIPYPETTAENLAAWLYEEMSNGIKEFTVKHSLSVKPHLTMLTLWETDGSSASVGYFNG